MKRISSSLLLVAASAVLSFFISFFPACVDAAEHLVPSEFATIQAAISSPTFSSGDTVVVDPGTYVGSIKLTQNVIIKGTETARTFLSGGGGGPVVTVAVAGISATIQNFTFVNASSGILISNNPTISIKNNVFHVGLGGTAISIQQSSSISVINNTFYQNGTALTTDTAAQIINNIFANNSIDLVDSFTNNTNVANNAFPSTSTITTSPSVTNLFVADPGFVDPSKLDFHLKELSPCIDKGNASTGVDIIDGSACDIGAYGGPSADPIPFPVSGLIITPTTDTSISLTWSPNNCYLVTNATTTQTHGGYNLYFGSASGNYNGELASGGTLTSPINVGYSTSFTLTSLTSSTTVPLAPDNVNSFPRDSALALTWSAVPDATGYEVHWGISSPNENVIDTQSPAPSWELSGLVNGQHYLIAVNAYAQQQYFFNVTAYDNQTPFHESDKLAANETPPILIGAKRPGALSTVIEDFPEALITYPALPNTGGRCFIATAAYGYYSAPEVQALRAFRDRYLLTSAPGRMFVEWYYRHGPAAAAFLNDHPGYKPVVRAALMPVVGAAIFMTETSPLFKSIVFLVFGAAIAFGFFRKRLSGTGGLR